MYGLTCPECFGAGCEQCNGKGHQDLERCAKEYEPIPHHVLRALALAREGHWPEPGGTLDQPECFMQALSIFGDESEHMRKWEMEQEKDG